MLNKKQSLPRLVKTQSDIQEGDIISYFCDIQKKEVEAEVLGLLEPVIENVIICRRLEEEMADLVDFHKTEVFILSSKNDHFNPSTECECGAQYTSNPRFHLSYCPMANHEG